MTDLPKVANFIYARSSPVNEEYASIVSQINNVWDTGKLTVYRPPAFNSDDYIVVDKLRNNGFDVTHRLGCSLWEEHMYITWNPNVGQGGVTISIPETSVFPESKKNTKMSINSAFESGDFLSLGTSYSATKYKTAVVADVTKYLSYDPRYVAGFNRNSETTPLISNDILAIGEGVLLLLFLLNLVLMWRRTKKRKEPEEKVEEKQATQENNNSVEISQIQVKPEPVQSIVITSPKKKNSLF